MKKYVLPVIGLLCLWPAVGPAAGLALGIAVALTCGNAYGEYTHTYMPKLLAISIIGLGAGMHLDTVIAAGVKGIGYTAISIAACSLAGWLIGAFLRVEREASLLITVGTAICGGSAIAAVAPVIHAKPHNMSAALAVVFCLNALALFLFPAIGHWAGLSEPQFGLWAALAIHDTSSVVGAGAKYGPEALQIATTVKLARALWIVPLAFAVQFLYRHDAAQTSDVKAKRKYPWFILGFLAAAALVTWVPALAPAGKIVEACARRLLVVSLFLIGANLTFDTLKQVGFKPMLQGLILWVLVAAAGLYALQAGWIS